MGQPVEIEFVGIENISQVFEKLPLKYAKKPLVQTFRKGARVFTTILRRNTPKATGETKKGIKVVAAKGKYPAINVGFSGKAQYISAYFKAYWNNYGTYSNRNASHNFKQPRKPITSHYKGGIIGSGFLERSWDEAKSGVQSTIDKELEQTTLNFLNKYKV